MSVWSILFPDPANELASKVFKTPGAFSFTAPANSKYVRATVKGAGGQGDAWGGGGAIARSTVPVTAGDNLVIQVGNTSTGSTAGDSFVKRNDLTLIAYADRGRGNGNGGKAAFSTGQITHDGTAGVPGVGGPPGTDSAEIWPSFGDGVGADSGHDIGGDPGAGGFREAQFDENSLFIGYVAHQPAGMGAVMLEFFDGNPGV